MRFRQLGWFVALLGLLSVVPGYGGFDLQAAGQARPVVSPATRSDTTAPLYELPEIPPLPPVIGEIFVKPLKRLPNREGSAGPAGLDPVLQDTDPDVAAPATGADFEGVGNVNAVLPPDPVGAIGPNHYVQMVNLAFAVYDRAGNVLYGPVDNNTLWQGFGGPCETTNDGDPIVLYDHLADRWLMSQFALPRFPRGPFYQCIAVSQTSNPIGAWHRYEFRISLSKLNDYPKFGLWPDGYYMAINQFQCSIFGCSWGGQGVVAFERNAMLNGGSARGVYFDLESVDPNLGGMLPADLDGPAPPAGAPNPFIQLDDGAWGYTGGQDQLQIWNFQVDWSNPANSTFTFDRTLPTVAFDSNLCGYSRNCIPQGGGTPVDAISDRLMFPLQYRNFGGHQTMVVNHTVDVDGEDHAGVRWYELRDSNDENGWAIHQQGTYAPDADHRWMGSASMNGAGDIALGYSIANTGTDATIGFTGRRAIDPPGQMTQSEGEFNPFGPTGYQTHGSGRWGDYSSITVDPADDCTFWYTQEYYASVGLAPWRTRVGSFKFAECGTVDPPPEVSVVDPADGGTVSGVYRVLVSASDPGGGVTKVELSIDGGAYIDITSNLDAGDYYHDWDTNAVGEGNHTLRARATDTAPQEAVSGLVNANVDNVNDPPVAVFGYICDGLSCSFDGSGSSDPDGDIASYDWDFGDGNGGAGATPDHAYAAADTYTVILTVTDDGVPAEMNADQKDVTVSEAAPAPTAVSCTPASGSPNQRLTVRVAGTGFQGGATADFGVQISVQAVTFVDSENLDVRIKVRRRAASGPRDMVITNLDTQSGTAVGCFNVN